MRTRVGSLHQAPGPCYARGLAAPRCYVAMIKHWFLGRPQGYGLGTLTAGLTCELLADSDRLRRFRSADRRSVSVSGAPLRLVRLTSEGRRFDTCRAHKPALTCGTSNPVASPPVSRGPFEGTRPPGRRARRCGISPSGAVHDRLTEREMGRVVQVPSCRRGDERVRMVATLSFPLRKGSRCA